MQITFTWQSIIGAAAIVGAFVALVSYLRKLFGWFEKQEMQDAEINSVLKLDSIQKSKILRKSKSCSQRAFWPA